MEDGSTTRAPMPVWETWMQFHVPGFSLAWLQTLQPLGSEPADGTICLTLPNPPLSRSPPCPLSLPPSFPPIKKQTKQKLALTLGTA